MYKSHKYFPLELNDDTKIWRYIDFTKFVSLIDSKKLYFSRADRLGDKFEGSFTKLNVKNRPQLYKDAPLLAQNLGSIHKNLGKLIYLNCWNIRSIESAAMWDIYTKYGYGIAIQSTIGRFKKCFDKADEQLTISKIKYINYKDFFIPEGNVFAPFFHKRKSYSHERELRAAFMLNSHIAGIGDMSLETPLGIYVPVDIQLLIKRIYLAPGSSSWFSQLINSILDKYEYKFKVRQSDLDSDPIY